jgi:myxalamid-type polyketide synthase MxaB
LITGGLGALGLGVANWLETRGAKQLALLSRRVPNDAGQAAIAALEQRGLRVVALQGDVSDFNSLQSALAKIPRDFPPLRGVVHAAGVLADGVIYDMDLTQFDQPLKAKIGGTWNLHRVTSDAPLDFFVMFSSVASVLGSPGQCNYAAANAYLDAMAAYRQADGKPAISINWGPWADAGMAAETHRQQQLAQRGMGMLPSHQALNLMGDLIRANHRQTVVLSVNWTDLLRAGGGHVPTLLRGVADGIDLAQGGGESSEDRAFRMSLLQVPQTERCEKLTTYFTAQLAFIMGLDPEDINPEQPLNTMGLDSLMAIELKNKIESRLQTTLPMAAFMHEPTVSSLAQHVAQSYGQETETGEPAAAAGAAPGGAIP